MARRPRLQYRGATYHLMARGNRKARIFDDDLDRTMFLSVVALACERYAVVCLAYCLMDNHYHLVVQTPRGNVSLFMQYVNGKFAQRSNRRHRRAGHLFEGPYVPILVDSDRYLKTLCRYVLLNPVAAGLVADPASWKWSSYAATFGTCARPPFLNIDWLLFVFDRRAFSSARRDFQTFIGEALLDPLPDLPILIDDKNRESDVRQLVADGYFGVRVPRLYRALARPSLGQLFHEAGPQRRNRNAAIIRAHVVHAYLLSEIARFLGLHPNSISKIVTAFKKTTAWGSPAD